MSTTVEDISSTKKRLKIEIPTDIIEKEYTSSLNNVRLKAKLPGFRPGNAPANLIEKKFGGEIKADIIDRLVPDYYSKALKEANLVPVTFPKLENTLDIKKNEPLLFSLTVEVRPNISALNYTGLTVGDIIVKVDDSEIEETLTGLQEEKAVFEVVDREIKDNDLIVIDYVKLDSSGQKELGSGKDQVMNLGNNLTPKGILDEIVGRKKGDVAEIKLPSFEGEEIKEETDKGSRIRVTIKEVKEKKLPAIDAEFAKDLGFDTIDALREKIKEGILKAKKDKAAKEQKSKLLDMLVESHDFDIPESILEKELETLVVNEKLSNKKSKELINDADKKTVSEYTNDSEIAEKLKPKAVNNAKSAILLDMIAEKEGVTVTEGELKEKIILLARNLQTTPDAVINLFVTRDGSLENFKHSIKEEKVLDLILLKAEIIKGE